MVTTAKEKAKAHPTWFLDGQGLSRSLCKAYKPWSRIARGYRGRDGSHGLSGLKEEREQAGDPVLAGKGSGVLCNHRSSICKLQKHRQ